MKQYFVQTKSDGGGVSLSVKTGNQIVNMVGFSDCSGDTHEVFASVEFGKLVKLNYEPSTKEPFNYHRFINPETDDVEIEGYSDEH